MPGERIDAILNADQEPGDYWVDVSTLDGHNSPAILRYEDDAAAAPSGNGEEDKGRKGSTGPGNKGMVRQLGAPTAELGCLLAEPSVRSRGLQGPTGTGARGSGGDVLDLSRGPQLPSHPSVPRPPLVAKRELLLYLVLSSDPATARPRDVQGTLSLQSPPEDKEKGARGGVGRVPGMNPGVEPMEGCPPLADGNQNRCVTVI